MTKRKPPKPVHIPPDTTLEQYTEFMRHQETLQIAAFGAAINTMDIDNPKRVDLATIARFLVETRPHLIQGPMQLYIKAILRMFAADNPQGRPNSKAIRLAVEFWQAGRNGVSLKEAHRLAARFTGRRGDAVRQARSRAHKLKPTKRQPRQL